MFIAGTLRGLILLAAQFHCTLAQYWVAINGTLFESFFSGVLVAVL